MRGSIHRAATEQLIGAMAPGPGGPSRSSYLGAEREYRFGPETSFNQGYQRGFCGNAAGIYEGGGYGSGSGAQGFGAETQTAVKEQADVYPVCLTSYEGHKVTLRLIDGKWMATVRENLSDGFINEIQLSVYVDAGMTIKKLFDATPNFQKRHIHVVFPKPSADKEGLVYVGDIGLQGGPSPGCIVAEKYGYLDATGHVGIVVGSGQTVSATSNGLIRNDFGFRTDKDSEEQKIVNGNPCLGNKKNVVYLKHANATRSLASLEADDIMVGQFY